MATKIKRVTKKDVYAAYGIKYVSGKYLASPIGNIKPLLIDGNKKIGKGCFHFSTLAGDKTYKATVCGKAVDVVGTCAGTCANGYCTRGNYRFQSTIDALAMRTIIARDYMEFCERAINAQIKADHIEKVRIHATGDFFSVEYLNMWKRIVANNPGVTFWTYTKEDGAVKGFDDFVNANIVKSNVPVIDGVKSETAGYNYGHVDYILRLYDFLRGIGKETYICRCGIDPEQHCTNCTACARCEHVLFFEHGAGYDARKDPLFPAAVAVVDAQEKKYIA